MKKGLQESGARQGLPAPKESQEQMALFRWAAYQQAAHPELELLHHIPNGGSRHMLEAANLKAEGVKAGVPDLCLPVARGRFHGAYFELKRTKGGRVSPQQAQWLLRLAREGYFARVCQGWEEAARAIMEYLDLGIYNGRIMWYE